ncbi:MAG: penicillin-binding protein 1A, partial [Dokdonella sp.]
RDGKTIYRANPVRACRGCPERQLDEARQPAVSASTPVTSGFSPIPSAHAETPATVDSTELRLAPRVIDARNAFLVTSLMRDVVRRGTGSGTQAQRSGRQDRDHQRLS